MPNCSQDATFVLSNTLPNGFPLQIASVITGCTNKIEKTRFIRLEEFSGGSTTWARNSLFKSFTSTRNVSLSDDRLYDTFSRSTDVIIVQKHVNIVYGVINMESLSQTWNENCHSNATCSSSWLDQALRLQTRVAQARMNALDKKWSSQLLQRDLMVLTLT